MEKQKKQLKYKIFFSNHTSQINIKKAISGHELSTVTQ